MKKLIHPWIAVFFCGLIAERFGSYPWLAVVSLVWVICTCMPLARALVYPAQMPFGQRVTGFVGLPLFFLLGHGLGLLFGWQS